MADKNSRQIRDFMTTNPKCVTEKDSIRDAAKIMKDQDAGVVPVLDGKKVIGIITDRDIVVRGIAEGKNLETLQVSELMTKSVRSVREDAAVSEVLKLMSSSEVRRIPVVNNSDELVGIVSIGDISINTNQDDNVGKAIESISEARPNN